MSAPTIEIGELSLTVGGEVAAEGQTTSRVDATGTGRLFDVRDASGLHLTVRDTRWDNGERDVVVIERHDSPQRFDTLVERLRLPVVPHGGGLYAELRQVRLKPNGRGNLFNATEEQLDAGAHVRVADALRRHGATAVGTREDLLGDTGATRVRWGVSFETDADLVPVVAYACTRIGPVRGGLLA